MSMDEQERVLEDADDSSLKKRTQLKFKEIEVTVENALQFSDREILQHLQYNLDQELKKNMHITTVILHNLLVRYSSGNCSSNGYFVYDKESDPNFILFKGVPIWNQDKKWWILLYLKHPQVTDIDISVLTANIDIDTSDFLPVTEKELPVIKQLFAIDGMKFDLPDPLTPAILCVDNYQPVNPPQSYELRHLLKHEIDDVLETWRGGKTLPGARSMIENCADNKKIIGLFQENSIKSISWALEYYPMDAMIGVLYTTPNYRSRGFAKVVISGVTNMILGNGSYIPYCFFEDLEEVLPSKRAFSRLGFQIQDCACYLPPWTVSRTRQTPNMTPTMIEDNDK